jgi:hypothetical protein
LGEARNISDQHPVTGGGNVTCSVDQSLPQGSGAGEKQGWQKNHPQKPTINGFLGFFKNKIFYENNTNFSL